MPSGREPGYLTLRQLRFGSPAVPMTDRRHQVLMAGLGKAGLYDLVPEDDEAVRALADRLDEPTVRRVAHRPAAAGGQR
ncbi:hypothetical protein ABZX74_12975 [Streptomyces olivaceoviridis]|uniref:hypothetical protein n=2 Tax=Streptomyces olivaceoviridis TaxID=1921 RepID=UPI0033AB0985